MASKLASAWKGVLDVNRKVLTRTGSITVLCGALILATLLFGAASALPVEAQAGPTTHTVQPGDTLARLATRYGVTVEALVEANEIENPDLIRVGQVLTIPASTGAWRRGTGSRSTRWWRRMGSRTRT
jgi:LysM repeat protein